MKHTVVITQSYRLDRSIEVEVEADSFDEALEIQEAADAPSYDDPRWVEVKILTGERVEG